MAGQVLIIGLGNMAGAMLAGWLAAREQPSRFAVLNRTERPVPDGVTVYASLDEAVGSEEHDTLMLGFKPQQLADLAPQFQPLAGQQVAVHSLLGGITRDQIAVAFPEAHAHLRVMPNLASRINKSPVLLAGSGMDEDERNAIIEFYDMLGKAIWLDDETQFDLMTALAGSGPAFVYRFIDALAVAGSQLGLDEAVARELAIAMVEGAATLAATADASPAKLAHDVASPGGMTRKGLDALDQDDALINLVRQALSATAERGRELSSRKF